MDTVSPARERNFEREMAASSTAVAVTVAPSSQNRSEIAAPISPAPPITTP